MQNVNLLRRRGGLLLRRRGGRLGLGLLLLFARGEDGVEDGSFHARHELNHAGFADVLDEAVDDVIAEFAVGHLAAAEAEAGLHLITLMKEADRLVLLGLVVVLVNRDGELDFLDGDDLLLLAGGALALFLLVEIATVILDPADGGHGIGGDFHQVKAALTGDFQSLEWRQDAELFAVFVDYADFARADTVIDTNKGLGGSFIESDGTPPKGSAQRCGRDGTDDRRLTERTLSIALVRLRLRPERIRGAAKEVGKVQAVRR